MRDPSETQSELWNGRWQSFKTRLQARMPFVFGLLAAFVAFILYNQFLVKPYQLTAKDVSDTVAQTMASATAPPAYSVVVYQMIRPSLILIQVEHAHTDAATEYSLGSGVVIDDHADILTSLHVVDGASRIQVTFADGMQSDAQVIKRIPEIDIAVLQADDTPLSLAPAVLGNPAAMHVGDEAFVVGNPFGLYGSMSAGVISGFDRTFTLEETKTEIHGMIQVDAAINPGNSGGPLLNRYGHVIGIVTGIINPTDENFFVGIGFAVPIATAIGGMGGSPPD